MLSQQTQAKPPAVTAVVAAPQTTTAHHAATSAIGSHQQQPQQQVDKTPDVSKFKYDRSAMFGWKYFRSFIMGIDTGQR